MKIATKFRIAALAPVVMAIVAGIAFGVSSHALTSAQESAQKVRDVVAGVNNLNTLVYSYMLHQEERPKQQFIAEHERISNLLATVHFTDPAQNRILHRLRSDLKSMKGLFLKMAKSYEALNLTGAGMNVREAGERLGGQLLSASSQSVVDGLALTRAVSEKTTANETRLFELILFLMLSITIVVTYTVAGMMTNVSRALALLAHGAEIIGSGDLHYQVGITSQDELGEVARAFDAMARKLAHSLAGLQKREEELRHSETRLRLAVDATGLGTLDLDALTGELVWSDLAKLHFGLSPRRSAGYDLFIDGVHPDDRERVQSMLRDVFQPGSTGTYAAEYRVVGIEDRKERWLSAHGQVLIKDGEPNRLITATLDITDRKRAEEALRLRESDLARAQAAAHLGSWRWDVKADQVTWSEELYRIFGVDPATFAPSNATVNELIHPDDRAKHMELALLALTGQKILPFECRIIRPGGEERVVVASGFEAEFNSEGSPLLLFGTILDITERKMMDEALRRNEARFRALVAATSDVLYRMTPKWEEMLQLESRGGLAETTAPDPNWVEKYIHPDDREAVMAVIREAIRTKSTFEMEHRVLHADGSLGWTFSRAVPVQDENGSVTEWFGAASDITTRKEAEAELHQAKDELELRVEERTRALKQTLQRLKSETDQRIHAIEELRSKEQMLLQQSRLAAMGELLVNISHQWRQPLNVVGLLLQDLTRSRQRGTFSIELLEKNVKRAKELINHMSQTIDDFRSYLNPERVKMPFDVREVAAKAISMVGESLRDVQVEVHSLDDRPIIVAGYRNDYAQVLINVLMNARDALRERGVREPRITVTVAREEEKSVVTIADNAGGIAPDVIGKIFDPYFTTKGPDQGTGIGLFMAKTIIEKNMGGKLGVSNTGHGALFRIEV